MEYLKKSRPLPSTGFIKKIDITTTSLLTICPA